MVNPKVVLIAIALAAMVMCGCEAISVYRAAKNDKSLQPYMPEPDVMDQKIGTNTSCHESAYGEGDGCLTWQDCVNGACVPETGRCNNNSDCKNGTTCQGYHWCR